MAAILGGKVEYAEVGVTIQQGRCPGALESLPDGSVGCIVTDPAYWTLDEWREQGTTARLGGHRDSEKRSGWFDTVSPDELRECCRHFYRLLVPNAHAWVMSDGQTLAFLHQYAREAGFDYVKPYPVLKRTASGRGYRQGMGYHGRAVHEYVSLLEKGRRRSTDEDWPDVFEVPWTGDAETRAYTIDGKGFPTAKPLALFERLLYLSAGEGEIVLDPFLGSGTAAVAAIRAKTRFVGLDMSSSNIEVAAARIEVELYGPKQLTFFP